MWLVVRIVGAGDVEPSDPSEIHSRTFRTANRYLNQESCNQGSAHHPGELALTLAKCPPNGPMPLTVSSRTTTLCSESTASCWFITPNGVINHMEMAPFLGESTAKTLAYRGKSFSRHSSAATLKDAMSILPAPQNDRFCWFIMPNGVICRLV